MAINPSGLNNGVAPDANYPNGSFQNETTPGALDGTELNAQESNDIYGFLAKILQQGNIAASGSADTANLSQYFQALDKIFERITVFEVSGGDANNIELSSTPGGVNPAQGITALRNGQPAIFKATASNTGAMTLKLDTSAVKDLKYSSGLDISAGDIISGKFYICIYNLSSDRFELATETDFYTKNEINSLPTLRTDNFLQVQDQKPSGTGGGSITSGSWHTRTLNTVVENGISGASLISNQITLPAGSYYIEAIASVTEPLAVRTRLRDTTNSADLLLSTNIEGNAASDGEVGLYPRISGNIQLAGSTTLELQMRTGQNGDRGRASSFGVTEIYADVQIWET
jgi:hypothetical protein